MAKTLSNNVLLLTVILLVTAICLVNCTREGREVPSQLAVSSPGCGDGVIQTDLEICDDGNHDMTDACTQCVPASCGDGYIWKGKEECDDGNNRSGDGCSKDCRKE